VRPEVELVLGLLPIVAAMLVMLGPTPPRPSVRLSAVVLPILSLAWLFVSNPGLRIYSKHGLFHASVLYRLSELGVPPDNPLLAGEPLRYHWGYELLGAAVSRVAGLPPSWSFAAINLAALAAVLSLLTVVAGDLFVERSRAPLSPLVAIFALTPIPLWWFKSAGPASEIVGPLMARATPVCQKFVNTNGAPLGLACLAVALFALGRKHRGRTVRRVGLVVAVAACGTLYPPLLPALLVTIASFSLVEGLRSTPVAVRLVGADAVACLVGGAVAVVVMMTLGMRPGTPVSLFDTRFLVADLASVVLTAAPIVAVIAAAWRPLRDRADVLLVDQCLVASAATALCFLVISLADRNEYKFLLVSQLLVGLVGGAAFATVRWRVGSVVAAAVAVVFLGSFVHFYATCCWLHRDVPVLLVEQGQRLRHPDPAQDQLYEWIGAHTPRDAVVVDSQLLVTVLGPRGLLVPPRRGADDRLAEPGHGFLHRPDLIVVRVLGADRVVVVPRLKLVQSLFDDGADGIEEARRRRAQLDVGPLWVICRTTEQRRRLVTLGAEERYASPSDGLAVMYWSGTTTEDPR
jgi:hypothetical protein